MNVRPFNILVTIAPLPEKKGLRHGVGSLALPAVICGLILSGSFARANAGESVRTLPFEPPNVRATVSKSDVHVAEPFTFELTVTAPAGTKVRLPAVGEQLGEFDVIHYHDVADLPSEVSPGVRIWTRRMTLESIVTGDLQVPAMEIHIGGGADAQLLQSEPLPIHVISVLEDRADPTRIRDIHSVIDVPVPVESSNDWIWWATGGLGILTLGTAAIALVARRKTWLTPGQWALRELEHLRESNSIQDDGSEVVTCKLTSVLADFLQMQFDHPVPVQTTDELLTVIHSGILTDSDLIQSFKALFDAADQVKFAGLQLTNTELVKMIDSACELVEKTAVASVAATTSGGGLNSERMSEET